MNRIQWILTISVSASNKLESFVQEDNGQGYLHYSYPLGSAQWHHLEHSLGGRKKYSNPSRKPKRIVKEGHWIKLVFPIPTLRRWCALTWACDDKTCAIIVQTKVNHFRFKWLVAASNLKKKNFFGKLTLKIFKQFFFIEKAIDHQPWQVEERSQMKKSAMTSFSIRRGGVRETPGISSYQSATTCRVSIVIPNQAKMFLQ